MRLLFWTDVYSDYPYIGRVNLDGSDKIVIVDTNLKYPKNLALDYEVERVYWCDFHMRRIEHAQYNGRDRTVLIEGIQPSSLALFGDRIFWTDRVKGHIYVADKSTGGGVKSFLQVSDPLYLRSISDQRFGPVRAMEREHRNHPCYHNNSGCDFMCLARPSRDNESVLVPSCRCPRGRTLADNSTCHTELLQYLLVTTFKDILQISTDTSVHYVTLLEVTGLKTASAVAVDIAQNKLYWINKAERVIYKSDTVDGHRARVVWHDLDSPEAIAVDWRSGNIYWADSGTRYIEVASETGNERRVLVHGNLGNVTSLALDLQSRTMYWVDSGDHWRYITPKIEMAAMDGTGRVTLVARALYQPLGIAVFHPPGNHQGYIYWTDRSRRVIERATLSGLNRTVLANLAGSPGSSPRAISVDDDFIYWTDNKDKSVYKMRREGRSKVTMVAHVDSSIGSLSLVRKDRATNNTWIQTNALSVYPCQRGSHGCSYLCLPNSSPRGFACQCPTGLARASLTTCQTVPEKFFLTSVIISTMYQVFDAPPDAGISRVVKGGPWRPMVFDYILYSSSRGRIFFSDDKNRVITSMNLDGTDRRDLLTMGSVRGLAVDWIGLNMYWTDFRFNTIEVARLDGTGRKTLYWYRALNGTHLKGIAVHPKRGLMFWVLRGKRPTIVRARMDGSLVNPIIQHNIGSPNAVAIDYTTDILYWLDTDYHRIESSDMSGGNRRVVLYHHWFTYYGFHVLVKDAFIYWSEFADCRLYKAPLPDSTSTIDTRSITKVLELKREFYNRPLGFTYVDLKSPREGELTSKLFTCGYSNGGCLPVHICLPITADERRCACPADAADCTEYVGRIGQSIAAFLPQPIESHTKATPTSHDLPSETTPTSVGLNDTPTTEPDTPTSDSSNTFNAIVGGESTTDTAHNKSSSLSTETVVGILSLSGIVLLCIAMAVTVGVAYTIGKHFIKGAEKDNRVYMPVTHSSSFASSTQSTPSRTGDTHALLRSNRSHSRVPLHLRTVTFSMTPLSPSFKSGVEVPHTRSDWVSISAESSLSPTPPRSSVTDSDDIDEPINFLMPLNEHSSNGNYLPVSIGKHITTPCDNSVTNGEAVPPPIPPRTYKISSSENI